MFYSAMGPVVTLVSWPSLQTSPVPQQSMPKVQRLGKCSQKLEETKTLKFSGVLDIQAFERLLGPCKELLERNIDLYAAELKDILSKDADAEE